MLERNITCIMGMFPDSHYDTIVKESKGSIQYAADALQKSILSGLVHWNSNIHIINLPYIGGYPKRYNKLFSPSYSFDFKSPVGMISGTNVPFCNLSVYKIWDRYIQTRKALFNKLLKGDHVVLVYAIHTPFLKACVEAKRKNNKIKIILIVPDLPEYMSSVSNPLRDILQSINKKVLNSLYKSVDGYVLLSDYMRERLPIGNKPTTVLEGIYNQGDEKQMDDESKTSEFAEKYILYTGTLARRYGIMNLVHAFSRTNLKDVKLYICGEGETKTEILEYVKNNPRIVYKGLVKRDEALHIQRNAMLLVNPRTPEGEFTKYSFPSKTMEYLASGVPTLLYRLPGIPNEYYDYCFSLTDISIDALTNKIEQILNTDYNELRIIGKQARNFILDKKNPKQQTKKIIDLINKL